MKQEEKKIGEAEGEGENKRKKQNKNKNMKGKKKLRKTSIPCLVGSHSLSSAAKGKGVVLCAKQEKSGHFPKVPGETQIKLIFLC